jgi:hypothetical protein
METIQIQCGSCHKLMAISPEHLGVQVRCPHCQAVVQTPPPPSPPAPQAHEPPEIRPPAEGDSIFEPPQQSDDLFDAAPQGPLVEMPNELQPIAPTEGLGGMATLEAPPPLPETTELFPAATPGSHAAEAPPTEAHEDLRQFARPKAPVDRGYASLMFLIFLVPYSILMTLFVWYLWHQLANQPHPLDYLPDPAPKKDGAKLSVQSYERARHDQPLAAHQKVPLGKTIRIGEVEVTPKKVKRDALGDLEITLHVKNTSTKNEFSPMAPEFLKVQGKTNAVYPYTFLDSPSYTRLYGGHLAFQRGQEDLTDEGLLKPGQEEDVRITTRGQDAKLIVQKILESNEPLTWRVQLRRGVVDHRSQKLSVTAVIGVVFNAKEIERGG